MTPLDVRKFQSDPRNIGPFGRPLGVDGDPGPQTQWALDFQTQAPERLAIARRALAHYGLTESAPNEDQAGFIRAWLRGVGAQPGDPWCAAFASACLLDTTRRSASAITLGHHYPETTFERATLCDLVWFSTDGKGHGHVEFLWGKDAVKGLVMTLGGNVANGVRISLRPADRVSFSQTVNDTRGACPGIIRHKDVVFRAPSYAGTR